jgi:hypothetical protein
MVTLTQAEYDKFLEIMALASGTTTSLTEKSFALDLFKRGIIQIKDSES